MKLSKLKIGDIGIFEVSRKRFIVVGREPEDRVSGHTTIAFDDGSRSYFTWDYNNPEVELIGRGKLITRIELDEAIETAE